MIITVLNIDLTADRSAQQTINMCQPHQLSTKQAMQVGNNNISRHQVISNSISFIIKAGAVNFQYNNTNTRNYKEMTEP